MGEEVIEELPKTIVRRVVKEKLSECSDEVDISLHKDALLAFSEAGRIFIHYISATANELCKESKRQTMNAEDVMKAIEDIEFQEFLGPLRASLEDYRRKNSKKRAGTAKAKEVHKKRKDDVPPAPENVSHTEDGIEQENNNNDNASDQELQPNTDDEGRQYNNENVNDKEQQNAALEEEEKSSEDAIDDEQNDEDTKTNNGRSSDANADEGYTGEGDILNHEEEEEEE